METVKKILVFLLKIGFSVAIVWYLLHRANAKWSDFAGLDFLLIAAGAGCLFAQNFMTAVRWHALLGCAGVHISFFEALSLTMQGIFFTLFIPAGSVSGDLVKAGLLAARTTGEARFNGIFSILADRLCGFAGLLLSVLVVVPLYWRDIAGFPSGVRLTVLAIAGFCAVGLAAIFALFFYDLFLKVRLFKKIWDWLDRVLKGFPGKVAASVDLFRGRWKTLLLWMLLSGGALFPLYAGAFYFISLTAAPSGANHFHPAFLGAILGEVISIVPVTPGGIGTRDVIVAEVFSGFGFAGGQAAVTSTVFTVVLIAVSALGAVFMICDKFRGRK